MATTPVFLLGKSHGQRSLVGYRPWGCKELYKTEWLTLSLLPIKFSSALGLMYEITTNFLSMDFDKLSSHTISVGVHHLS